MASDAMTSQQSPVLEDHYAGPFYGSTDSRDARLAFTRQVSGQKRDWRSNSLNCPTCNGTGRIGSERANELVALIPCSDKRLKPRRLTFYIIISIVTCMVLCSLIVFFIYPRTICISELSINNLTAWTENKSSVSLNFTLQGTIHNDNFYSIKVSNITYEASFFTSVVSTTDKNNFTIPTRSSHKMEVFMILEMQGGSIFEYCTMEHIKIQMISINTSVTVTVLTLGQNMQGSQHALHFVDCHIDRPSHIDRLPQDRNRRDFLLMKPTSYPSFLP